MNKKIILVALGLALTAALTGCSAMHQRLITTYPHEPSTHSVQRSPDTPEGGIAGIRRSVDSDTATTNRSDTAGHSSDLTVEHLAALIGMNSRDLEATLGKSAAPNAYNRVYSHNLYGKTSNLDVALDNNEKIEKITVKLNKEDSARWQRELDAHYSPTIDIAGSPTRWNSDNANIEWHEHGGQVEIVFTNNI